jgi:hypothetical protein
MDGRKSGEYEAVIDVALRRGLDQVCTIKCTPATIEFSEANFKGGTFTTEYEGDEGDMASPLGRCI